jgi:ADP-heptose:LPS heptosyltransferase
MEDEENWDLHLSAAELKAAKDILHDGLLRQHAGLPLLGLSIGTKQAIKDWGDQNWLIVLNGLKRFNFGLVMIGAAQDKGRSQVLADSWHGPTLNLCGQLSPRLSAAVMKNFALFLCHDSGPMHLAASVGTRCVAVFSRQTPPGRWFPYGKNHTILYPQSVNDTIQSIKPNQAIAAATEILQRVDTANLEPEGAVAYSRSLGLRSH